MSVADLDFSDALAAFEVGDEAQFEDRREWWTVRAMAGEGRYTILTTLDRTGPDTFGEVLYTILDGHEVVRGPLNVIGGGLGIDTTEGRDENIDQAVELLEKGFEVSHRNRRRAVIQGIRPRNARGPIIRSVELSTAAREQVWLWLQANGCRWLIPFDAEIRIKGQYLEVDCYTVRSNRQVRTLWPKRIPLDWTIPTKTRRFRIRIPLNTQRSQRTKEQSS